MSSNRNRNAGDTYRCRGCDRDIPVMNRNLHELRCVVPNAPAPDHSASERWTCSQCTFSNPSVSERRCAMCEFRLDGDEPYIDTLLPREEVLGSTQTAAAVLNGWTCPRCTLQNLPENIRCEACNADGTVEEPVRVSSLQSNAMTGLLLGAVGGAMLNHFYGRSVASGAINGAALGALGAAALDNVFPRSRYHLIEDSFPSQDTYARRLSSVDAFHRSAMPRMLPLNGIGNSDRFDVDSMSYEDLLNIFGGPSQQPARARDIQSLPTLRAAEGCQGECCICMDQYSAGQVVKTLPCLHVFHGDCVDKWLKQSGNCPICKFQLSNEHEASRT